MIRTSYIAIEHSDSLFTFFYSLYPNKPEPMPLITILIINSLFKKMKNKTTPAHSLT